MQSLHQHIPFNITHNIPSSHNHAVILHHSSQHHKQQLIKAIRILQTSNDHLQARHEHLQNTLIDLRKLMQTVSLQNDQEIEILHKKNVCLENEAKKLSKALKVEHQQGNHLRRCQMYWNQFL